MSIYSREQEEQLVETNMPLVVSLVKSFRPPNSTEFEEYLQCGSIGLLKAIRKHNPTIAKLSTIAWYYIRWEIIRYMNKAFKIQRLHTEASNYLLNKTNIVQNKPISSELFELLPTNLNQSEQTVILMRHQGYTFQEIGTTLGNYTRGWASKLYKSAIEKIKSANEETYFNTK